MNAPIPCRAQLTPTSDGQYGVGFVLMNSSAQEVKFRSYEPFTRFRVQAKAAGAELAVVQPTLDIPVRAMTIRVPPSGSYDLITPVRLQFRPGPPSQQRFVWSIAHESKGVQLTFTLELPPPFDQPFTTQVNE